MKISHPKNIDINSINTLIFDWGGVITNISPLASIKALKKLGHPNIQKYFEPNPEDDLFFRLEEGRVSPEEVYQQISSELSTTAHPQLLRKALCAMMLDTPPQRLQLLQKLREHFRLFLLSNTNIIHTTYYQEYLMREQGIDFQSIFHKIYYSYEMGMRKPGREIFSRILEENMLPAEKTLFLDDTIPNIETARSLNIQTIAISRETPIEKIFSDWLSMDTRGR